jgi:broad specificity phosphatase PhoE
MIDLKTLYMVRHGQTDSNLDGIIQGQSLDVPLNEKGIEQAKKVAEFFNSQKLDLIVSSDLIRAYQSAKIIGKALNIKIEKDRRLREMNFGEWEGNSIIELTKTPAGKIWEEKPSEWEIRGSETLLQVQRRIVEATFEYIQKADKLLLVTHGTVISTFLLHVEKLPLDMVKNYFPKNGEIFKFQFHNDHFEMIT